MYTMSGDTRIDGVVDSYDDMTPIPVISYNPTNNALVFSNALVFNTQFRRQQGQRRQKVKP